MFKSGIKLQTRHPWKLDIYTYTMLRWCLKTLARAYGYEMHSIIEVSRYSSEKRGHWNELCRKWVSGGCCKSRTCSINHWKWKEAFSPFAAFTWDHKIEKAFVLMNQSEKEKNFTNGWVVIKRKYLEYGHEMGRWRHVKKLSFLEKKITWILICESIRLFSFFFHLHLLLIVKREGSTQKARHEPKLFNLLRPERDSALPRVHPPLRFHDLLENKSRWCFAFLLSFAPIDKSFE